MTKRVSKKDRDEFAAACQNCTDAQLRDVWEQERTAGYPEYATIAMLEARDRKLDWARGERQ